jgi:hypothetical protein
MLNLPHEGVQITSSPHIEIYKLFKDVLSRAGAGCAVKGNMSRIRPPLLKLKALSSADAHAAPAQRLN